MGISNSTLNGGLSFTSGRVGQAFNFDGVDDYLSVPDSGSLDLSNQVAISAWVNPDVVGGVYQGILGKGDWPNSRNFRLGLTPTSGEFTFRYMNAEGGEGYVNSGAGFLTAGTWSHIVAVIDSGANQLRLYHNGTLVARTP